MLDALIRLSLRRRGVVLLLAALLLLLGGRSALRLPVDVFPDLNRPTVTVLTEAGGLSPEEVEAQVTRPIELAMAGAPGVLRTRSQSAAGLAVVWVELDWDTDLWRARQQVTERLVAVGELLPDGARPHLGPVTSIMGEILLIGLVSTDGAVEGPALRTLADTVIRPAILAVPGIANVVPLGGGVEQLDVAVLPDQLAARQVTLEEVRAAAALAQGTSSGGFLEQNGQELVVRHLARSLDPVVLGGTPVATRDGGVVRLADVAALRRGVAPMRGDAGVRGLPGVVLSVQKQPGADTVALTAAIGATLEGLRVPEGVELTPLFRQADFIEAAVNNVEEALRDGAILVLIILLLFLQEWRTTVISLTAIPLSLLASVLALDALGLGLNTMTLGGLAVAVGELVDDAIVDVENVLRRLKERGPDVPQLPPPQRSVSEALNTIAAASSEVRGAIVYSTALVVLVFVPLFALSGVEGRMFTPLGVAYVTSIAASMVVSLTVTPALCMWLLPQAAAARPEVDGWLVRRLKALDARALRAVLPRPGPVMVVVGTLVAVAVASVPYLPTSFLPPFHEGTLTINLIARPGIGLEASDALGRLAERLVLEVPEVTNVGRRTGRAEGDEHAEGVHYTELDVDLTDGRPRDEVVADLRARLAQVPGVGVGVGQPISHRLDHLQSGVRAEVVVKIFGEDLAALREQAERVRAALADVPGLVDLQVEPQVLIPQARVTLDDAAGERFGVPAGRLLQDLETAFAGTTVARVPEGARSLDVVVRYDAPWRSDLAALGAAPLVLDADRVVSVDEVARLEAATGPNQVLHEDGRRRIVVSANTAGRAPGSVAADVEARVRALSLPPGTTADVGGQHEAQREAARSIGALAGLSLLGMYAVLYGLLRSHVLVAQVLINVPLALVGSVAALWWTGQPLSVATMVGFVTLCGIATRNTILMISHYVHLAAEEGLPFGPELVLRGSLERLVPVVMTALAAGIALVPLALSAGQPGKELLTPVAQVILGGLLSSTLLDLLVTPTLFLRYGQPGLVRLVAARADG